VQITHTFLFFLTTVRKIPRGVNTGVTSISIGYNIYIYNIFVK